ncbi:MAG: tRNA uridine-5-carboxymethylaminomethyl(34) synthesis enzyme MnmG, partial [Lentisphaeria bacterium]|nr:tRNA uridine-5-carboxymethylaminomethyl(34) synthesis enzyme MnmG [Lentisphaeria bacterium]
TDAFKPYAVRRFAAGYQGFQALRRAIGHDAENGGGKEGQIHPIPVELLIQAHYDGYLQRESLQISRLSILENMTIPQDFDYENISGLSNESKQKLIKRRPATLGAASRIDGVTPSDIALLQVLLKKHCGEK